MFRFDLDSDELARAYRHASAYLFPSGRKLVDALGLGAGDRVLDVGCGTGLLADYVSRIVGPEGMVIGIDPLPRRIAIAQQRQRSNLRFQVGNAFDLSAFGADSFDAAYLHLVFHWLPEKVEPLRQLHRVLHTGARAGLTTSTRERENTFQAACATVLSRSPYRDHHEVREPADRRVGRAELERLLRETGFRVTHLEIEPTVAEWPTADEAIAFSETISAGNVFGHLPESLRQSARIDLAEVLESRKSRDAIRIEGARIVAVAVKR